MPPTRNTEPRRPDHKFTSAADVRRSLGAQEESSLIDALTTLRNQFTVKPDEPSVSVSDERLLLIKAWLEKSPGAQDVFNIWDTANPRQMNLLSLVVSVLSSMITLLSAHYLYQPLAQPIVKSLVSPQYSHRLNTYLGGSHNDLVLVTMKLFNSLSNFASGRERKTTFEVFAWETKTLPRLLHMRRKGKSDDHLDILTRPDGTTSSAVKTAFLEQRRDIFVLLFKGLWQDQYSLVRKVLEVCWTGLWSDQKVRKTLKVGLFNETVLSQVMRVYERDVAEDGDLEHIPADVVHHYMLAICTRPGVGVCFKDRGWYPRELDQEEKVPENTPEAPEEGSSRRIGRIYNKILANVLKMLKVNEDPRQQELALKILAACPELVAGYWSSAALALEPRNSSKWLANIAFFGTVVSLPVPHSSFVLSEASGKAVYNPAPPPLTTIVENTMPSAHIKAHLSRGLQAMSSLVQHSTALALVKCLRKYDAVLLALDEVENALEEDEEGQWHRRRSELEREIRKRVPEFQVVVAFAQKLADLSAVQDNTQSVPYNPAKYALLSEIAQRLLWLYQRSLPSLVAEARFDIGKLLSVLEGSLEAGESTSEVNASNSGMDVLRKLHVLRLLSESDQFNWSGKTGISRSNLNVLLRGYVATTNRDIRTAITHLLHRALSASLLFQHDPEEVALWLEALPVMTRCPDTRTPDGVLLTSEPNAVISFVDDCAQRCFKTPYRYLENLEELFRSADDAAEGVTLVAGQSDRHPSPLLMTILEQFEAKVKGQLLSASDTLAIVTFIRKLCLKLLSKMDHAGPLRAVATRLNNIVMGHPHADTSLILSAIQRELDYLNSILLRVVRPRLTPDTDRDEHVESFLEIVEIQGETTPLPQGWQQSVYDLIDWYRVINHSMNIQQASRLCLIIEQRSQESLREFLKYLRAGEHRVWDCIDMVHRYAELKDCLSFDVLLFHSDLDTLANAGRREILVQSLFKYATSLRDIGRAITLVHHALLSCCQNDAAAPRFLVVLSDIVSTAQSRLNAKEFSLLHVGKDEQRLIRNFGARWTVMIKENLSVLSSDEKATGALWIKYMAFEDLLVLLDCTLDPSEASCRLDSELLQELLQGLSYFAGENSYVMQRYAGALWRLRPQLSRPHALDSILAQVISGSLPLGLSRFLSSSPDESMLSDIILHAQRHWVQHGRLFEPTIDVADILSTTDWSDSTVDVLLGLLYTESATEASILSWLKASPTAPCTTDQLARILLALLDSQRFNESTLQEDLQSIVPHFDRLLKAVMSGKYSIDAEAVDTYTTCVSEMLRQLTSIRPKLLINLQRRCEALQADYMSSHMIRIAKFVQSTMDVEGAKVVEAIVDRGLKWIAQLYSGTDNEASTQTNVGLVEDFSRPSSAESVAHVLHTAFHLHPSNACQPTHIEPLLRLYGGTASVSDRRLLDIFQLFEVTRKTSIASLFHRWSASPDSRAGSTLEAVQNLDPNLCLKTCLSFPDWRRATIDSEDENLVLHGSSMYDPLFLILLFAQLLQEGTPTTASGWVQLFRTNIASVLIRAVSAQDDFIRATSIAQLAALHKCLQEADMQEQPHVIYVLNLLKDAIPKSEDDFPPRLPVYTTLLLAHALRGIFYPANFIYPITARFLLQRSELDTGDVPMLFGMLYSSSEQWKKERAWIVRFLSDGMVSSAEWNVLKRRHTWDLLASLFQNEDKDTALRRGVLEIRLPAEEEALAWIRIVENILAVLDSTKIEQSTHDSVA
ncbi:hypothetical protein IEO21_08001 [Rhodonia placenta]|uniref:Nucleolar pre-ribosomal-associated protein 1 C-terminal domain-containing protein n=1 Tax=Rhodonia placenta TaxID=104341 RepID=A0A8H7NX06_9APHY|nr:hypothetical protein IEO21_08001 [Postia placenta]